MVGWLSASSYVTLLSVDIVLLRSIEPHARVATVTAVTSGTGLTKKMFFGALAQVWRFEKRDFWAPEHARRIGFQPMPPSEWDASKKWTMQAGEPVTKELWDIEVRERADGGDGGECDQGIGGQAAPWCQAPMPRPACCHAPS